MPLFGLPSVDDIASLPPFPDCPLATCTICQTDIEDVNDAVDVAWLSCGHTFHADCLRNMMDSVIDNNRIPRCPNCREHVDFVPVDEDEIEWALRYRLGGMGGDVEVEMYDVNLNNEYEPRLPCVQCTFWRGYHQYPTPPCTPVCLQCRAVPGAPMPPMVDDDDLSTEPESVSTRILYI